MDTVQKCYSKNTNSMTEKSLKLTILYLNLKFEKLGSKSYFSKTKEMVPKLHWITLTFKLTYKVLHKSYINLKLLLQVQNDHTVYLIFNH